METHRIVYGNKTIEFIIKRKKVKNVNLNIKPDMTVEVSAHEDVPLDFICDFVRKKQAWITQHMKHFKNVQSYKQSDQEYVSGESYKYLGKQHRLRVQIADKEEMVKYFRGYIYVFVKDTNDVKRKAYLMEEWYRDKARKIFQDLLNKLYPLVEKYGIKKPSIDIKIMKARWG